MNEKSDNFTETNSRTKVYGAKLKSARVSLQKSIDEIAAELNLHKNVIESIEEMDEDNLPNSVFVKGYIRTYAKCVQIDSEELIKDFSDVDETEVIIEIAKSKGKNDFTFEPNLKLSLAVIAIIVLLLVVFSFTDTEKKVQDDAAEVATDVEQTDINQTDAKPEILVDETTKTQEESTTSTVLTNQPSSENLSSQENLATSPAIENSDIKPLVSATDKAPQEPVTSDASKTTTAPAKQDFSKGLLIKTEQDAWMEIRDENNKRLYSNVLTKGSQKYFANHQHFKLIIGRSNSVKIDYFGQPVQFSNYTKSNGISRFDITKNGIAKYSVPKVKKVAPVVSKPIAKAITAETVTAKPAPKTVTPTPPAKTVTPVQDPNL